MISRKRKSNVIETDFLPSVLEVLETPPLKGGRIVSFSITVFILLFLGWSFSFIDMVSIAQGKVIPLGHVKIIQPQEQGKITEISVIEGQKVKQGDILLKLDKTLAEAELEKIYLEQKKIEDDILLLTAYNARYSSMAVTRENDLLQAKKREFFFNLKTLQDELAKSQSTVNIVEASIVELKATLPVISEKYKSYETLYQQGHVSKVEFLNLKEQKIQREQEYASQLQRRNQALADIQKVKSQIEALKSSDKRAVSEELSEKRVKLSQLKEEGAVLAKPNKAKLGTWKDARYG
jgi:hemolysin D